MVQNKIRKRTRFGDNWFNYKGKTQ